MRSADALTILRVAIVLVVAYMILVKFAPVAAILLFGIALAMDGLDGYLAIREESSGKVSLGRYLSAVRGDVAAKKEVAAIKARVGKKHAYGARFDIAGDRITEYVMWILFTYLMLIPLIILIAVVIRNSVADSLLGARGTSSKMKSRLARLVYTSNVSRSASIVFKFLAFSYLTLVYVLAFPVIYGYILVAILFIIVMARGVAEIYDALV